MDAALTRPATRVSDGRPPTPPLPDHLAAPVHGGHVRAHPEGRVGRAPDGWPERGRCRVGDGNRARTRIAAAITRGLVPLRAAEGDRVLVDPTRPTTGVAAFPGGVVPDDVP